MKFNEIEIWKDIDGYEGIYQISDQGRVKSLDREVNVYKNRAPILKKGKILNCLSNSRGYYQVGLHKNKCCKRRLIHRLVAQTFISNYSNKKQVRHINEIKTDNRASNLKWVDPEETHKLISIKKCRPVLQFNKEGIFIKQFKSIREANSQTNVKTTSITKACQKKLKSAGGFIWEYANEKNE